MENPLLNRSTGLLALGIMAALLVLAVYFTHARMLFVDAPFILSNIINEGHPMIMEHRYGSIITQLWPWLGTLAGLPLEKLMWIYNASFNMFYLLVCALLVFKFKEYALAVLMALYYTLMVSDAFYWTNNEIHQAMGWMFLWLGIYKYQKAHHVRLAIRLLSFELMAALAVLTHPLMILIVSFVWIYLLIEEKAYVSDRKLTILFSSIIISIIIVRIFLSIYFGWYDAGKFEVIQQNIFTNALNVFDKPLLSELVRLYYMRYMMALCLFAIAIGLCIYEKKYLLTFIMTGFFILYNLLFLTVFDSFIPFYSESELMPLTVIFGLPFVYLIGKYLKVQYLMMILSIVFIIRIVAIFNAGHIYNNRVEATRLKLSEMKAYNITKLILTENDELKGTYIMSWGLPVESLFASIISGDPVQRTFIIVPPHDTTSKSKTPANIWLDCFRPKQIKEMNPEYFRLDTTSNYGLK